MFRTAVFSAFVLFILTSSGCSGYEKLLKSDDFDAKYEKAKEYYNEGDYAKAIPLLDQLLTVKSGTAQEEEIRYYIAFSHYGQNEYLLSSSLFRSFWLAFPRSYRAEECLYMSAYCLYKSSPGYELDQTETERAMEYFQFFIDTYKSSERIPQCNDLMDEMRLKMERKMFESASQYFKTENYQAAAVTYENMLEEFPETREAENIGILIIRSYFNYAVQSIICKKEERYDKAIVSFNTYKEKYPDSENMNEAESLYKRSISLKEKAKKEKENYNCNE